MELTLLPRPAVLIPSPCPPALFCRAHPHLCAVGLPQPPHSPTPSHAEFTPAAMFPSAPVPPPRTRRGSAALSAPPLFTRSLLSVLPRPGAGAHPTALLLLLPRQPPPSFLPTLHPHRPPRPDRGQLALPAFRLQPPPRIPKSDKGGGCCFQRSGVDLCRCNESRMEEKNWLRRGGGWVGESERAAVVLQSLNNAGS